MRSRCELESENAALTAELSARDNEICGLCSTIDELAALNEKINDEAIRLKVELKNVKTELDAWKKRAETDSVNYCTELKRYKGALRTMASEYVKDHPVLNEPEDVKAIGTEQRIRLMIAYALAHPDGSLDEISSKDYGDGVGLTHAEIDAIEGE
jgi:chromosome segregation ATPase